MNKWREPDRGHGGQLLVDLTKALSLAAELEDAQTMACSQQQRASGTR
jgi:hypothetical protein